MKTPCRRLWPLGEWECRSIRPLLLITSATSDDSAKEDAESFTFDVP